jgi:hypothetical protein
MASTREPVSFPGKLHGAELEADCTVRATKVSLPDASGVFAYVDYLIENVSKQLPDGLYQLSVNGETISVNRKNGFWLSTTG